MSLKEDLCRSMLAYLNQHLCPVVKKSLNTQQTNEILRCIADWAYQQKDIRSIDHAKSVMKKIINPNESLDEEKKRFDFMEELKKI